MLQNFLRGLVRAVRSVSWRRSDNDQYGMLADGLSGDEVADAMRRHREQRERRQRTTTTKPPSAIR